MPGLAASLRWAHRTADFARQRHEPYPVAGDGRQRLYSENDAAGGAAGAFAPAPTPTCGTTARKHALHISNPARLNPLQLGQLCIDPVNREVHLASAQVHLSTSDFDLLWELATHAGTIMDRDALLQNLRGVSYDGLDRSIDVAISRLRRKLHDTGPEPVRIKTVRNKGYLFAPNAWE